MRFRRQFLRSLGAVAAVVASGNAVSGAGAGSDAEAADSSPGDVVDGDSLIQAPEACPCCGTDLVATGPDELHCPTCGDTAAVSHWRHYDLVSSRTATLRAQFSAEELAIARDRARRPDGEVNPDAVEDALLDYISIEFDFRDEDGAPVRGGEQQHDS
jgi:ribosomal protein S27AE